jgi:hypothetical protein
MQAKSSLFCFHFRTEDFALRAELVRCCDQKQPEQQHEEKYRDYLSNERENVFDCHFVSFEFEPSVVIVRQRREGVTRRWIAAHRTEEHGFLDVIISLMRYRRFRDGLRNRDRLALARFPTGFAPRFSHFVERVSASFAVTGLDAPVHAECVMAHGLRPCRTVFAATNHALCLE